VILLGRYALVLAAVFSLAAVAFLAMGVKQRSRELIRNGYFAVYGLFLSVVVASAVLLQAFLTKDFSFLYVFQQSDATLSVFYRVAGFWAGQQGSFLLWLLFLAVIAGVIALKNVEQADELTGAGVLVLAVVSAFFAALLVFDHGSNPFVSNPDPGAAPYGMNPLLLHPAMVLHPPTLFLGYAALTVPFAFAIGALALRRPDALWVRLSQKWGVMAWLFLSVGIGLGAWWAYVVLGWGGYWGWDPVENSSLIPWLTATALLHSLNLYAKRGTFKRWTITLATVTFLLTIVATWVTRSGAIQSQHAFESAPLLSAILLTFMGGVAVVTAVLLATRWSAFEAKHEIQAIASKDFMYYFNNTALTVFAGAILFTTVGVPLLMHQTVQAQTYDAFARPLGILFLLVIAACPLMAWGRTDGRMLWRNLRWPLVGAAVGLVAFAVTGWGSSIEGLLGLAVCAFAAVAVVQFLVLRAGKARGKSFPARLWNTLTFSRTRTGGIVSHIGTVLIVVGLIGSNIYKIQTTATLPTKAGATATAGAYTVKFVKFREGAGVQRSTQEFATFDVFKGGKLLGRVEPHIDFFPTTQQTAPRAVIMGGLTQDLFVAPDAFDKTSVSIRLNIFPLIRFLWVGVIVLVGGSVVSLWPARSRVAVAAEEKAPVAAMRGRRAVPGEE
jgi:cytochrome c-type biogenesis protein CcmF